MHDYIGPVKDTAFTLVDKCIQTNPVNIVDDVKNDDIMGGNKCTCQSDKLHSDSERKSFSDFSIQADLPDLCIEDLKDNDDDVIVQELRGFILLFRGQKV